MKNFRLNDVLRRLNDDLDDCTTSDRRLVVFVLHRVFLLFLAISFDGKSRLVKAQDTDYTNFIAYCRENGAEFVVNKTSFNHIDLSSFKTYILYYKRLYQYTLDTKWLQNRALFFSMAKSSQNQSESQLYLYYVVDCSPTPRGAVFDGCSTVHHGFPVIHEYSSGRLTANNYLQSLKRQVNLEQRQRSVGSLASLKRDLQTLQDNLHRVQQLVQMQETDNIEKDFFLWSRMNQMQNLRPCEGAIEILGNTYLNYTQSKVFGGNLSVEPETCVWLLYFKQHESLNINVLDYFGNQTKLRLHYDFNSKGIPPSVSIGGIDGYRNFTTSYRTNILVFSSEGWEKDESQGFQLLLSPLNEINRKNTTEDLHGPLLPDETIQSFRYPTLGLNYEKYERQFFLFKPPIDKRVSLTIPSYNLESEANTDILRVFKFSGLDKTFKPLAWFWGVNSGSRNFHSEVGEIMLVYFFSDSRVVSTGFHVDYSAIEA